MQAAESGNTALATQLLKRGARHDAHDNNDYTPLDYAASAGQRKMSELLLATGAEIATQNSACGVSTTIDQAERRGHARIWPTCYGSAAWRNTHRHSG